MIVRRRFLSIAFVLLALLIVLPTQAQAHAHLVRADLAPDSHVLVRAGTYRFWFDESLNAALSRIIIRDSAGRQVNTDTGNVNPANDTEMDVLLGTLSSGQYSVFWTSDSAQDGHILHGFYLFTVGGPGAAAPSAAPTLLTAPSSPTLDGPALSVALAHWLVLIASSIWTGALALELLVLRPARVRGGLALRTFSADVSLRTATVARLGLMGMLLASIAELETEAYTSAGWGGLTSRTVLRGILSSHYGTYWIVRMLLGFLTIFVLTGLVQRVIMRSARAGNTHSQDIAGAWSPADGGQPIDLPSLALAVALGLGYLLALALSGHAAAVQGLVASSVLLDWLHLISMAVWIGGMSVIALALVPALLQHTASADPATLEPRLAFLNLLDRFSPAAFIAVATAAATGMFNAQVHLDSFDALTGTAYGRFLLIKLALIAEIMVLSASHVFFTRPRLARRAYGSGDIFASLALRLRIEPLIGTLILLCVALMGQVAPSVTIFNTATTHSAPALSSPTPATAQAISGTVSRGVLSATLRVTPAAVGQARFFVTVRERGKVVTDAQVRIKLSMPGNTSIGAVFVETTPGSGGYTGSGDLVQAGSWQADVLVRTRSDPEEFRDVPFIFLIGPDATFLNVPPVDHSYGSASVRLSQPQDAPDILSVQLKPGLSVRYEISMPAMPTMGTGEFDVKPSTGGWYSGMIAMPMAGLNHVAIQVRVHGAWHTVRLLIYLLDENGHARLLTP